MAMYNTMWSVRSQFTINEMVYNFYVQGEGDIHPKVHIIFLFDGSLKVFYRLIMKTFYETISKKYPSIAIIKKHIVSISSDTIQLI